MDVNIHRYPNHLNAAYFLVDDNAARGAHLPAILWGSKKVSYGELQKLVNRFGNGLKKLGIRPGERLLCRLPAMPEAAVAFLGAMKVGAVPVASFPFLSPLECVKVINGSDAVAAITLPDVEHEMQAITAQCPGLKWRITVGAALGAVPFQELVEVGQEELEPHDSLREEIAFLCYTSGTTRDPKGLPHSHQNILVDADIHLAWSLRAGPGDVFYSPLPFGFAFGLAALLFYPLRAGAAVVYPLGRSSPEQDLNILERHRVTHLMCTGQRLESFLSILEEKREFDLRSLKVVETGASVVSEELFFRWQERFGVTIQPAYGLSEIIGPALGFPRGEGRGGTLGRLNPGWEAKVLDEEGRAVPDGQIGTLWIRGPNMIPFYWKDEASTKKFIKEGWLDTRDLVTRDEDGFFYYTGRADDQIKSSGWSISPQEIEEVIFKHPAVAEVVVVGAPHRVKWEVPVAFVVTKDGWESSPALEEELKRLVKAELAGYKCPRAVYFLAELPRTASGKLMRRQLKEKISSLSSIV